MPDDAVAFERSVTGQVSEHVVGDVHAAWNRLGHGLFLLGHERPAKCTLGFTMTLKRRGRCRVRRVRDALQNRATSISE